MAKKIKVLQRFLDKDDKATIHRPGSILDVSDERADDLVTRGLAESADEVKGKEEGTPIAKAFAKIKAEREAKDNVSEEAEVIAPEVKTDEVEAEEEPKATDEEAKDNVSEEAEVKAPEVKTDEVETEEEVKATATAKAKKK
jgi:hypothetical protein